jgi:hypothetical protein
VRRRAFIAFLGGGAIAWSLAARAQVASTGQNIRLVVGFSAGGATDIAARVLAGSLSQKLGQQVFVENRTGAKPCSRIFATNMTTVSRPWRRSRKLTTCWSCIHR